MAGAGVRAGLRGDVGEGGGDGLRASVQDAEQLPAGPLAGGGEVPGEPGEPGSRPAGVTAGRDPGPGPDDLPGLPVPAGGQVTGGRARMPGEYGSPGRTCRASAGYGFGSRRFR